MTLADLRHSYQRDNGAAGGHTNLQVTKQHNTADVGGDLSKS